MLKVTQLLRSEARGLKAGPLGFRILPLSPAESLLLSLCYSGFFV